MITAAEAKAIYNYAHKNDAWLIEQKKKEMLMSAEEQLEVAVKLGAKSMCVPICSSIESANEHVCFKLTEEDFKAFKDAGYNITFAKEDEIPQCRISWVD